MKKKSGRRGIDWHSILQDIFDECMWSLSGKRISAKGREHQQSLRLDYLCHTDGDDSKTLESKIIRPLDHLKTRNIIEYKSYHKPLNEKIFREYVGRALLTESYDKVSYQGETTLTILNTRYPKSVIEKKEYSFEEIEGWKYKSSWIVDLDIYILVQTRMRNIKGGEALALLQLLEGDKKKREGIWKSILSQNLKNFDQIKEFMNRIQGGVLMNVLKEERQKGREEGREEVRTVLEEERQKGREEGREEGREKALSIIISDMLNDGLNIEQISKTIHIPKEVVSKIVEELK